MINAGIFISHFRTRQTLYSYYYFLSLTLEMALGQISLCYDLRLQIFTNINRNNQLRKTKNPSVIQKNPQRCIFEINFHQKVKNTGVYKKYVTDLSSLVWYCKYLKTESCFGEVARKQAFTSATSNKHPWK